MKRCIASVLAATIAVLVVAAGPATAHPGHGFDTGGLGLLHFLLQPSHGAAGVVVAVVIAAAATASRIRRHR